MAQTKLAAFSMAFSFLMPLSSPAQTFTQQVQQHQSGEGTVTIHHDATIDRLVNAASADRADKPIPAAKASTPVKAPEAAPRTSTPKTASPVPASATKVSTSKPQPDTTKAKPQSDTTKAKPQPDTTKARPQSETTPPNPSVSDTTAVPSAPRHGYKTTGYRVQAFAGGNTRKDRQKAERTGNAMRQLFPGEDVYVRFYSPRWVCRVGNYRSYEEAHEKMQLIRKMGYESATIVKGKIIVYHD